MVRVRGGWGGGMAPHALPVGVGARTLIGGDLRFVRWTQPSLLGREPHKAVSSEHSHGMSQVPNGIAVKRRNICKRGSMHTLARWL